MVHLKCKKNETLINKDMCRRVSGEKWSCPNRTIVSQRSNIYCLLKVQIISLRQRGRDMPQAQHLQSPIEVLGMEEGTLRVFGM